MNLEQVKKDRDGGVMICRDTWGKVLEAALLMESTLIDMFNEEGEVGEQAFAKLKEVNAL